MEVGVGYRQTEIGVIPEDWDTPMLGDLFTFKNGLNKDKSFFGYGTPIVNYMDVYGKRGICSHDLQGRVSLNKEEITAFEVRKGDVFFTRTSETAEEVGITSVILDEPRDTVFSGFVLRARPRNDTLDDQFKKYCFSTSSVRKQIISQSTETTRALTNGKYLSAVVIARPPKTEQTAIAASLSDIDALIRCLEKLTVKKHNIKKGAMQQLLTGQKRLPGFSGKWVTKRLEELCRITTGKKDVDEGNPNGQFPFFTCSRTHTHSDSFSFDTEAILIAGNGDVGNLHYYNGKFEAYQRTYVLTNFLITVGYLWQQLNAHLIDSLVVDKIGSSIPYIKKESLLDFEFICPNDSSEQTAIAQVLSDMDAEIKELEYKFAKYKMIKQGMMQELLTGKKRLI